MVDFLRKIIKKNTNVKIMNDYYKRFKKYSFKEGNCISKQQYEASITKLYHTIEKGLSYPDYHAGFGIQNINKLIDALKAYSQQYDTDVFFYQTALSVLQEYVKKNKVFGVIDEELNMRIEDLPGHGNDCGGCLPIDLGGLKGVQSLGYLDFIQSRHSVRHFSDEPVSLECISSAIKLAQQTPSACNRQGWKAYIVTDFQKIHDILENQNGNRGFGNEINKLLVIVSQLEYFNNDREVFQGFIDGGMYAMNLLYCLHYNGVGTIPLSASLNHAQEINVRRIIGMKESEELIMFIGVGNYAKEEHLTTKSERRAPSMVII